MTMGFFNKAYGRYVSHGFCSARIRFKGLLKRLA